MKAAMTSESFDVIYNNDEEGFFGLTTIGKRRAPLLNTPRAVAFAILELSKVEVLKAHINFFQRLIRSGLGKLLFTDTDSLMYLLQLESLRAALLESTTVEFDMRNAVTSVESVKRLLPHQPLDECKKTFAELEAGSGRLGAFEIESNEDCIVEYVGLAPKMYSLQLRRADGDLVGTAKGKGVPSGVLKREATHADFYKMLFEPHESRVTFRKLQSFKHHVCGLEVTRSMLTALQDKTYQLSPTESRPLGHWRNRQPNVLEDSDSDL